MIIIDFNIQNEELILKYKSLGIIITLKNI